MAIVNDINEIVILPGMLGGVWHSMRVKQIRATGTTATGIRIQF